MKIIVEAGDERITGLQAGVYEFSAQRVQHDPNIPHRVQGLMGATFTGEMGRVPLRNAFLGYSIPPHTEPRQQIQRGSSRPDRMVVGDPVSGEPYASYVEEPKYRDPAVQKERMVQETIDQIKKMMVADRRPVHDELHPQTHIYIPRCKECAGTGLWENPANGRRSPCSRGCKAT